MAENLAGHRSLQKAADALQHWHEFVGSHAGSRAALDLSAPAAVERRSNHKYAAEWGSLPVDHAQSTATAKRAASDDYLLAFSILLPRIKVHLSLMALWRSLCESTMRALWLLDPDIDVARRVQRAMTEDLEHLRLFNASAPDIADGISAIARSAEKNGFRVLRQKRRGKRVTAIGEARPSLRELFDIYLPPSVTPQGVREEGISNVNTLFYQQANASVHGHLAAVVFSDLYEAPLSSPPHRDPFNSWARILAILGSAFVLHYRAFDEECRARGELTSDLRNRRDAAAASSRSGDRRPTTDSGQR